MHFWMIKPSVQLEDNSCAAYLHKIQTIKGCSYNESTDRTEALKKIKFRPKQDMIQ